jgi:2-keto-3-deoxy-L-fuconate dehydrogenase
MPELTGRRALVTGAASGIGAAIASTFRREGAEVAGLDIAIGGGVDHAITADLRDTKAVKMGVEQAEAALGPFNILVHAAAASHHGGCLDTDPAVFRDLYDVNVGGAVRLLQALVPGMRAAGGGAVVMLSSINASFATPTLAAYAATKAALNNLVQTAALELAPDHIRINAIAPASIDTPAMRASYARHSDPEEARRRNAARHPLERIGSAEEVAELALFLVSSRAEWITGSVYRIDGGASVTRR